MHPKRVLTINAGGVHDGDFVMVMGYPGRTDRYASSFAVHNTASQVNPIQASYRKEQMKAFHEQKKRPRPEPEEAQP